MKTCNCCGVEKPFSDFHKKAASRDGHRSKCKSCIVEESKGYYLRNKSTVDLNNKNWRKENPDSVKTIAKRAQRKQVKSGKNAHKIAKRRASKLQATPSWLSEKDQKQIKLIYTACSNVTERTGKPHHVDHIVPLQGENVCGLHVPWNLAIIPASMNLSKSNKF